MRSILILDDEQAVRQSLVDFFEDRMWEPLEAESAEEALVLFETQRPEACIVDIRLPGMDGNGFLLELAKRGHSPAALICTGSPEYVMPKAVQELDWVSAVLFKKPVKNLRGLEEELIHILTSRSME